MRTGVLTWSVSVRSELLVHAPARTPSASRVFLKFTRAKTKRHRSKASNNCSVSATVPRPKMVLKYIVQQLRHKLHGYISLEEIVFHDCTVRLSRRIFSRRFHGDWSHVTSYLQLGSLPASSLHKSKLGETVERNTSLSRIVRGVPRDDRSLAAARRQQSSCVRRPRTSSLLPPLKCSIRSLLHNSDLV